jgi:hypothetical protein
MEKLKHTKPWLEDLWVKDNFSEFDVSLRIILKLVLDKYNVNIQNKMVLIFRRNTEAA